MLVVILALIILALIFKKRYTDALVLLLISAGMMVSVWALKLFFAVPRPEGGVVESGYAFPSGHASGVTFLSAVLYYYGARVYCVRSFWFVLLLTALTLAVSYSRIVLGVHTPLQVLAGIALGALWAYAGFLILQRKNISI